jgi:hypothetical protein
MVPPLMTKAIGESVYKNILEKIISQTAGFCGVTGDSVL